MASWTLWQPLVPRYQLTAKEVTSEEVNIRPRSTPASPRVRDLTHQNTPQSPKAKHSQNESNRRKNSSKCADKSMAAQKVISYDGHLQRGKATMYFTMASTIGARQIDKGAVMKPAFPARRSQYIDTFKQQQRIIFARQSAEDPSTSSPRHKPTSPGHRKQRTVSQFPVTQIENQDAHQERPRAKTAVPRSRQQTKITQRAQNRVLCKSAGAVRDAQNISVNTIDVSDSNPKPYLKNPMYKDPCSPRRYAVRKLDDATMFIDDDKIIFIKKKATKNDILLSQNTVEETNYIKHLRRLYLREPKDAVKLVKEPPGRKSNVIRERLEYDLKTDHILNYYSRVDDKQDASLWAMAVEQSRRTKTPLTTPRSTSGIRRTESARNRPNIMSSPRSARSMDQDRGKDRPGSARSVPYSNISSENVHLNHDSLSDWNMFLKFNTQSILHERQFYLQTPTANANNFTEVESQNDAACDNHECRLCLLEKEMGRKGHNNNINVDYVKERVNGLSKKGINSPIQTVMHNKEEIEKSIQESGKVDDEYKGGNKAENTRLSNNGGKPELCTVSTSTADLGVMDEISQLQEKSSEYAGNLVNVDANNLPIIIKQDAEEALDNKHNKEKIVLSLPPATDTNVSDDIREQTIQEEYTVPECVMNMEDERGKLDTASSRT